MKTAEQLFPLTFSVSTSSKLFIFFWLSAAWVRSRAERPSVSYTKVVMEVAWTGHIIKTLQHSLSMGPSENDLLSSLGRQTYCSLYCRVIQVAGTPRTAKPEGSPSIFFTDFMVLTVGLVRIQGGIAPG